MLSRILLAPLDAHSQDRQHLLTPIQAQAPLLGPGDPLPSLPGAPWPPHRSARLQTIPSTIKNQSPAADSTHQQLLQRVARGVCVGLCQTDGGRTGRKKEKKGGSDTGVSTVRTQRRVPRAGCWLRQMASRASCRGAGAPPASRLLLAAAEAAICEVSRWHMVSAGRRADFGHQLGVEEQEGVRGIGAAFGIPLLRQGWVCSHQNPSWGCARH